MKKLIVFLLGLCSCAALAQDIPNHSMPIGRGPGSVGWGVGGPCPTGQALVYTGGAGADPACAAVGGGGGGGGGLNITHAQIPTTNTSNATSLVLTGYTTANDLGSGAPYTCSGQSSTSVGAIQDSAGTWCAFDVARVANMDGFRPGWFGAKGDGSTGDSAAFQAAIDATFNAGLNNLFCPAPPGGSYSWDLPVYFDPPGDLRGGVQWTSQIFGNGYQPGSIVSQDGKGAGLSVNNDATGYYGYPPNSPDYSGFGFDLAYKIVSSTTPVSYNPTYNNNVANGIGVVPLKGSGALSAPTVIAKAANIGQGQNVVQPVTTTTTATVGSTIVVGVNDWGGVAAGPTSWSLTDTRGNVYTRQTGVDNATIGGTIIFTSVNIGTALQNGDQIGITNNSVNWSGAIIAASITNATAGVDSAALVTVDNTNSPTPSPTATSGTLAQSNEIVIGWLVANAAGNPGFKFAEASGFTTLSPALWSPATWNVATTYNAGDHVFYPPSNPIPWSSITNGNVGNVPTNDLGANGPLVNWQPITVFPAQRSAMSEGATFHGTKSWSPGTTRAGCVIQPQFNNTTALIALPGNGVVISDISIYGPNGATRCGQPVFGVGIAEFGGGQGSNRVKYENVTVSNFYIGLGFGLASIQAPTSAGTLGAENHIYNPVIQNTCYALFWPQGSPSQAFINSVYGGSITDNGIAIYTPNTVGVIVEGGNYSHENGPFPGAQFTMTNVGSLGATPNVGYSFTATLATPGDTFMTQNCSETISSSNLPQFLPSRRCEVDVYNTWMLDLRASGYGIVPFIMSSFNRSTGNATFWTLYSWFANYGGRCCGSGLTTAIAAATSTFAAEMTRIFVGNNLNISSIHIEPGGSQGSGSAVQQLVNSSTTGGGGGPVTLKHIFFDGDITACNLYNPGNVLLKAACFSQQEFPWIDISNSAGINGDVQIEDTYSTVLGGISGETNMVDLPDPNTVNPGSGGHLVARNFNFGQFNYRVVQTLPYNGFPLLSGGYGGYGSAAFGSGDYEMAAMTGAAQGSNINDPNASTGFGGTDVAWLHRTQGLSRGPFYGTLPAPWATPCISPLDLVKASTYLPPIWLSANNLWNVNYALLSSGTQYKICNWNLATPAFSSSTNYFPGSLVTIGGNVYVSLAGDSQQVANTATPGVPQFISASISGNVMNATVTSGRLILHSPITSGATTGTAIVAQQGGSLGSTGTYTVYPTQTVAATTMQAVSWATLGTFHYGAVSNHGGGYSYGQDLTSVNVPGLSWEIDNNGPFVRLLGGRAGWAFPGLVAGFAGTQVGCTSQENFVIREVHYGLNFFGLFLLDSDVSGGQVPGYGANTCSNTTIKQSAYSITNLN